MNTIPTFPVLKLLTDEEIERALARTYTLQEGPDQHDYLRSDRQATNMRPSFEMGICFFGEAFGMDESPSGDEVASILYERRNGSLRDLEAEILHFIHANDLVNANIKLANDGLLRAVVAASRAES